jgi:hypothetical protein
MPDVRREGAACFIADQFTPHPEPRTLVPFLPRSARIVSILCKPAADRVASVEHRSRFLVVYRVSAHVTEADPTQELPEHHGFCHIVFSQTFGKFDIIS